jgi:Ca-activated chloride channel family protein
MLPYILFALIRFTGKYRVMNPIVKKRAAVSAVFFGLFLFAFIIALAGPYQSNTQAERAPAASHPGRRETDLVIALDVSRSMDIRDIPAGAESLSRLQRGVSLALDTVKSLPEIRYATAVGRGRGVLAVPLTRDSYAIINFLEAVNSDFITGRGTNLESLLDAAAGAFQDTSPSHRYILLVSDGEALSGSLRSAVERCRLNNIAVITLALGSDIPQPLPPAAGGELLTSSRDQKAMFQAAELSGGLYVDGNRADALGIITGYLRSRSPQGSVMPGTDSASRWFLFIIIAIVCYGVSRLCLLNVKNKKQGYQR